MKKLILFLLFSCSSGLEVKYNQEGITEEIKTQSYTKKLERYLKDDEKIINKVDTIYKDTEKGRTIDYYLVLSISENNIYQRLNEKNNEWVKGYHNINSFLSSMRHLKAEVENDKFKRIILSEDKDDLEESENGEYGGKRYEINKVVIETGITGKEIVFKNNDDEVIKISYQKVPDKDAIFTSEKEIENYFVVKAIVRDKDTEVIGVYFHFYDKVHENKDLDDILPFSDESKDIKLTLVRNKDLINGERITVSNNFRIIYNGNTETLKGKDEKIFHKNLANSSNKIENILSFYTILDMKEFFENFSDITK